MLIDYIKSITYGVVQGITEFLPVSSSGHLVLLHRFLPFDINNELVFDIFLHLATIIAVVFYFRKDIYQLIKSWVISFSGKFDKYSKLAWLIILATVPAGVAGYFLEDLIENIFRSVTVVIFMLVAIAILFFVSEKFSSQKKDVYDLSWVTALMIGISQVLAFIPGTSRSGITIIAGLAIGLKRKSAASFSFLLSVPIILGASLKKIPSLSDINILSNDFLLLSTAFFSALIVGFFVIKYFLKYLEKRSLNVFAWYRILLAIIVWLLIF